jgi:DNA-binding XRE family transcriptional regulator
LAARSFALNNLTMKTKQSPKLTLAVKISHALKTADPALKETDEIFKCAAILLASATLGPDEKAIATGLGYPLELVNKFAHNLRTSKIWKGGKVYADWDDKETGGTAFWCDVLVGQGLLKRGSSKSPKR